MKIVKLECTGCGAPLKLPKQHKVLICPFCGTESVIVGLDKTLEELNPAIMISPLKTRKAECQKELLKWLSEGDLTPDDLLLKVKVKITVKVKVHVEVKAKVKAKVKLKLKAKAKSTEKKKATQNKAKQNKIKKVEVE